MTTAVLEARTYPFDVEDIEYLRHGDKPLLARRLDDQRYGGRGDLIDLAFTDQVIK